MVIIPVTIAFFDSDQEVIPDRRFQSPQAREYIALNTEIMFILCREDTGSKDSVTVVDKDLDGAGIHEDPQMVQPGFQRTGTGQSFLLIERQLHPAAVHGDLPFFIVIADGDSALPCLIRKEVQADISGPAVHLCFRCTWKGTAARFVFGEYDGFIPQFFQFRQRALDQPSPTDSQLSDRKHPEHPSS